MYHRLCAKYEFRKPRMAYSLRQKPRKNYQELADVKLPRSRRLTSRPEDVLYQVDVVEEDDETGRVKVHYVGYGDEDDEWKDGSEIVLKSEPKQGALYLEYS